VEDRRGVGVLAQVVEEAHPVDVVEGGLAGPHAMQQMAPRPQMGLAELQARHGAQRSGHVGAETGAERRQGETAGGDLGQQPDAGEKAQNTFERGRVRSGRQRQLVAPLRTVRQPVGDTELGGDVDGLRHPVAAYEPL